MKFIVNQFFFYSYSKNKFDKNEFYYKFVSFNSFSKNKSAWNWILAENNSFSKNKLNFIVIARINCKLILLLLNFEKNLIVQYSFLFFEK